MPAPPPAGQLSGALAALVDLVLPARCGGCERPGQAWCTTCEAELAAAAPAARWAPTPSPPGLPEVWSVLPYQGVTRACLVSWKDNGRRDLARVLAPVLTEAVLAALLAHTDSRAPPADGVGDGADARPSAAQNPWLVVPVPSGRRNVRRRGDRPLLDLAHRALRALPPAVRPPLAPALRLTRAVADQAGLDRGGRADNLRGAMGLTPRLSRAVPGARCLVVDDVITTGATLVEAARALRVAGAAEVVAVTLAATRRRGSGTRPAPRRQARDTGVGEADSTVFRAGTGLVSRYGTPRAPSGHRTRWPSAP